MQTPPPSKKKSEFSLKLRIGIAEGEKTNKLLSIIVCFYVN